VVCFIEEDVGADMDFVAHEDAIATDGPGRKTQKFPLEAAGLEFLASLGRYVHESVATEDAEVGEIGYRLVITLVRRDGRAGRDDRDVSEIVCVEKGCAPVAHRHASVNKHRAASLLEGTI
jgi:hypothetical protein